MGLYWWLVKPLNFQFPIFVVLLAPSELAVSSSFGPLFFWEWVLCSIGASGELVLLMAGFTLGGLIHELNIETHSAWN